MRGIALVCLVTAAVGCASAGGSSSPATTPETVRINNGVNNTMTTSFMNAPSSNGGVVAYPAERVWSVMRAVYDSLSIPVANQNASVKTLGNADLRLKRRLGDVALSKYINCGSTQGFPSADTYEVFLSVMTQLSPTASGGTQIATTIQGQARPITISGEPVRCTSLTTLESRIVALVNTLLKA